MLSFVNNDNDILSKLFGTLSYDLQEKIYNETLIIQDTQKNKRYFSGCVLNELKYYSKESMDRLNEVYQYLECGKRIVAEEDEEYCVQCDIIYDELYYENLDYLLKCDIHTEINVQQNEICFHYKLKDIYSFEKKYYDSFTEYEQEHEDDWRFKYTCHSYGYDLNDFMEMTMNDEQLFDEELIDQINNMWSDNFDGYDNETIKLLLYKATKGKIFI
jgi:hypothetical protein